MKLRFIACLAVIAALMLPPLQAFAKQPLVSDTLPNGMKVYVLEDHNSPLVAIQTWIRTGLVNESYKTRGMSHFLEHLLFKGTKKRKVGELDRELDAIGAYNNAATYYDYTYFQVVGASCYFDKMLDVQVDGVLNSTLDTAEVEKERKVVVEEIKMGEDNPYRVLYKELHRGMYDNLPYSYPVIGFQSIIESVPRDTIYEYYKSKYHPKNMFVVVVGDVNPQAAISKIKDAFAGISDELPANEKLDSSLEENIKKPRTRRVTMDSEKTYAAVAFKGTELQSDDAAALDVLANIMGNGDSSRLNQVLKEKNKLVEMVASGNWNFRSSGMFFTFMMLDSKNIAKAKDILLKEFESVRSGKIADEDIEKAKNSIETSYILAHQNYDGMAEYLGEMIALASETKYESYIDEIKKVTKEDLVKAANKYLYPEGYLFVTVEPKASATEVGK